MDYLTKPTDRKSLRALAKIFREIFEVPQNEYFPVLDALELMPNKMPGVIIEIVADSDLPFNVPAQCELQPNENFIIKIKESVYNGAYEKNIGAYRDHILHEMCHMFLYRIGFTPILQRNFDKEVNKKYESVEWQAKALCGEIMMPYEESQNMTTTEIVKCYGVSKSQALYRKKY